MIELIAPIIVGIIAIVIGIQNIKGNISSLHRYHRKRVSEADRLPFGRMVGIGTIIIGISIIFKAFFQFFSTSLNSNSLDIFGSVLLAIGMIVGFGLIIFAMIKYNRGLF